VVATIKVKGLVPSDVATGFGAVWVSETNSNSLARIDPKSNKQTDEIKTGGYSPDDVATGFGSVWSPLAHSNQLERISP